MTEIRYVQPSDREFWYTLDRHMPESEFDKKVRDREGYVVFDDGAPVGILRYNLFWDNTPFCNLIFIEQKRQNMGFGRKLLERWERDMSARGFDLVLTSTRSDEQAQHFYRKLGYSDCGALLLENEPAEIILMKRVGGEKVKAVHFLRLK